MYAALGTVCLNPKSIQLTWAEPGESHKTGECGRSKT
jgi:hypothetical protein